MINGNTISENAKVIYFAGGCFWGTEKLFQSINGVIDGETGYANGNPEITPDYTTVCLGDTGYRETVKVVYDESRVSLRQLLKAYFYAIDPTVEKRQGADIGEQYQTGIYYADEKSGEIVNAYVEEEKKKYENFFVEVGPLTVFHPAEAYHQNYLDKYPGRYCHLPLSIFGEINDIIGTV